MALPTLNASVRRGMWVQPEDFLASYAEPRRWALDDGELNLGTALEAATAVDDGCDTDLGDA
jgi:hypothetical protein